MDARFHEVADREAIWAVVGLEMVEGMGRTEVGHVGQRLPDVILIFSLHIISLLFVQTKQHLFVHSMMPENMCICTRSWSNTKDMMREDAGKKRRKTGKKR